VKRRREGINLEFQGVMGKAMKEIEEGILPGFEYFGKFVS